MTGAVYDRTPNLGLGLIEFNFPNWADDANFNMQIVDAAMQIIGVSIKGGWANNTPYIQGDLVVDTDLNSLWRAQVNHVSSVTGTMAEERAAHPTYWADASSAVHARGEWQPFTTYYTNDIVWHGYAWALVTHQHVSTASFDDDVATGKLVIITDTTNAVEDAEQAATDAANSASAAASSASTALSSANNAIAAATAASGSAAAASTSANEAQSSENDAELAADRAEAALAAMLPDAPIDSKYYGRYNESWQEVIGEAPSDGIVYARKSGNWVPATGAMIVSDSPPPAPRWNGMLWYESDTGNSFMWYTAPSDPDSSQWVQISGFFAATGGSGGGIAEAPVDSKIYARKDSSWFEIGASGGVPEAPMDGKQYVREDGAWVEVDIPVLPAMPFSFDPINGDAILKFGSSVVVRIKATGLILTKDDIELFSVSV